MICRNKIWSVITSIIMVFLLSNSVIAANTKIEGVVTDAQTEEPLFGANVMLIGTALGAASDMYGKFDINNPPAGTYILKASYLGYKEQMIAVDVEDGKTTVWDFVLEPESIEGQTVIVTAQASGQKAAINQQLTSKRIMNVVSSARIQELPDANAAESVGRLPGISIQRNGGEGNKLVVRGLEPKYNAIMINGVRLSSTNPNDRSVDLSMISPYMLDGIEVSKNVTPDQDADVLGGSVNFKIKTAGGNTEKQGLGYNLLVQGGYNGLSNAYNKANNFKLIGSIEGRYLDGDFGFFAQGDFERRNLTSNQMGLNVTNMGNSQTEYKVNSLLLQNVPRDRQRFNGTLVLDYKVPDGVFTFTNIYSSGTTDEVRRSETFDVNFNQHLYDMAFSGIQQDIITNSLNYEQELPFFDLDANLSHTYAETKDPSNWNFTFREFNAFNNQSDFKNQPNIDPRDLPFDTRNDFSTTLIEFLNTGSNKYTDRSYTAAINLKKEIVLSSDIITELKVGGKYRSQEREYDSEIYNGATVSLGSSTAVRDFIINNFNSLSINSFLDENYEYGDFLDNEYQLVGPLNQGMLSDLASSLYENRQLIEDGGSAITYSRNTYLSKTNDYKGKENLSAAYAMATIDIGESINIITGARFQRLETEYTGARGIQRTETQLPYLHSDTTATKVHTHLLPSLIIKIKPTSWFDLRLAYTNTLSYPDFQSIIPRIDESGLLGTIAWNNYDLEPIESTNFDAYLSFYENHIGLFTIGAFYKEISNQIYAYNFFSPRSEIAKYFPWEFYDPSSPPAKAYNISTFINNPNKTDLWGLEFDWQTHFWYLPAPFDGIVMNVNYTHTFSETQYPIYIKVKNFPPTYEEQTFTDRLISQPNDLFNLSVGYDYKDFSIRVSMLYQDDIFAGVNFWPQLRTTTDAYTRWDVSVKQKLPWYGVQVFALFNNINNEKDSRILQMYHNIPEAIESYGMTATLGLRWSM